jgi:hypothetical protein
MHFFKMIRQKFLFLSLFLFPFSFTTFAQKVTVHVFTENYKNVPGSDTIYYHFNQPLHWSDFTGKVPDSVPWGAMTASGFSFNSSMSQEGNQIDISVGVYTFFTKHDSWKKSQTNTPYQLEHEQHHFDITRLGAAKLEHEIKQAHFTPANYKTLLNSIFNKIYDEEVAWQHEYDLETRNSLDSAKQLEWNKKISEAINKLKNGGSEDISLKK